MILGAGLLFGLESFNYTFTMILQGVGIALIVLAFVLKAVLKRMAVKAALGANNLKAQQKLDMLYQRYLDVKERETKLVQEYEGNVRMQSEILRQLSSLI